MFAKLMKVCAKQVSESNMGLCYMFYMDLHFPDSFALETVLLILG